MNIVNFIEPVLAHFVITGLPGMVIVQHIGVIENIGAALHVNELNFVAAGYPGVYQVGQFIIIIFPPPLGQVA